MRRRTLHVTIVLFALVFAALVPDGMPAAPHQLPVQRRIARIEIHDFTLTDQNSNRFDFKDVSGKVVVVAFAYTTCPDICPLITASLRQVQLGLGKEERRHVRLVTVTTDPEIDSPKVLAAYAKRYSAEFDTWSFLTGDSAALKKIWQNFGVGVERKRRGLIDHTPLTAIVDQKRFMRFVYIGPSPNPEAVLADVRAILKER